MTLSVGNGVVTDTLTRTNYLTVSAGIGYTYECAASLKRSERDPLYCLTGAGYRSTRLTASSSGERFEYAYEAVTADTSTLCHLAILWYTHG